MGNARDLHGETTTPRRPGLHLLFPGDERSVRDALKSAMHAFQTMDIGPELRGVVEIVLAEVLNNVVEHAYADHGRGVIELEVEQTPGALAFRIRDDGRPMPDDTMPEGRAHDLDVTTEDLPEGGFGWFLIRELTEDLRYRRTACRNELTFRMRIDTAILQH